jgi:NAD(P)H-flavin reductase
VTVPIPPLRTGRTGARATATDANPYRPAPARILRVIPLAPNTRLYDLRFEDPELSAGFTYRPGQFVELSVFGIGEGPFSLPSSPTRPGILQLGIRRAGRLTGYLFDHIVEGDLVGIRGPLGNGFPVEKFQRGNVVLVAGGLGMVPLRGLLRYLIDLRQDYGRITLLYGSRTPDLVLFRDELESIRRRGDADITLTVDTTDGQPWTGEVGYVTELLGRVDIDVENTHAVVCGPPVFYKFMLDKLVQTGLGKDRIFLNLERRMECGIGKCGHCAVGYTFTCLHGPVFSYWDAINLPELIYT